MSLDLNHETSTGSGRASESSRRFESVDDNDQWKSLRKKIRLRAEKKSAENVFGESAKKGSVYRWGIAVAQDASCDPNWQIISRLACNQKVNKKLREEVNILALLRESIDGWSQAKPNPVEAVKAVVMASALPELIDFVGRSDWWATLSEIQQLRESVIEQAGSASLAHLIIGGELGLTLAWRLSDLPSCARMQKPAIDSIQRWCQNEEDSIATSVKGCNHARLALASLIRCRKLIEATTKTKFKKQQKNVAADLATWVAAMTTDKGGNAFCELHPADLKDDTKKHGLLDAAVSCDKEALEPAINAARGKTQTGGRLVWEISLPELVHHCDESKTAILLPEWDVQRGRIHIDYSEHEPRVELFAGKSRVLAGRWQAMIELDDNEQRSIGQWVATCEYSDDDVHYLELEQPWTGGIVLQRQFMIVRDDRSVLWADSVLPSDPNNDQISGRSVRYSCRLPLAKGMNATAETETREVYLGDKHQRAIVIPIAANEWRVGPSDATLRITEDDHLLMNCQGTGRLYAPIWFDFQRKRFKCNRTWRQLTVADELRIVRRDEAVGYRIQLGSEQWLIYRSLGESRCRSVLGKHLVADFFAGRFYLNDGSTEEIVTVDETDHES
ncbi:MAG: hypothetical protein HKN47_18150 [Pirellulaceae bacterium]|nr:hypothetical protein [Pirellulaceae bacterium]